MKTISLNANTVDKKWVVIDASDKVLGRVATKV
ncbi:MAG: 50S ribosomal protein L13, partial [Nitrospina sp.]|nr:50S ribosomal protein L13 [Nitrospina sp.]